MTSRRRGLRLLAGLVALALAGYAIFLSIPADEPATPWTPHLDRAAGFRIELPGRISEPDLKGMSGVLGDAKDASCVVTWHRAPPTAAWMDIAEKRMATSGAIVDRTTAEHERRFVIEAQVPLSVRLVSANATAYTVVASPAHSPGAARCTDSFVPLAPDR
jgi:hypothetical protein